ncbi:MAG: elongation factor P [Chitinivibrionales bacterium]|nr:elongation factor P [Chitinivibrionales bacterium]
MAMTGVNNIKKKNVVNYKGDPCLVLECLVRTPPNLASFCQMELRSLKTNRSFPVRCNIGQQFDVLNNDYRTLEFSYENRGEYIFIDQKTFDSYEIQREKIEDVVDFLVPNHTYETMFVEDRFTLIDLPSSVTMRVEEAPEGVRGDTSGNVTKSITLETGLVVQAPLFVKKGDLVKISTEDKSYQGRA